MRIIGKRKIDEALELLAPAEPNDNRQGDAGHPDHRAVRKAVDRWLAITSKAKWKTAEDVEKAWPRVQIDASVLFSLDRGWVVRADVNAAQQTVEVLWMGKRVVSKVA